jgi:hypothetical protein
VPSTSGDLIDRRYKSSGAETNLKDVDDMQIIKFQDASQYAFESGALMACLIILHNWFPAEIRGFIVSLWVSSVQIICIIQAAWYPK